MGITYMVCTVCGFGFSDHDDYDYEYCKKCENVFCSTDYASVKNKERCICRKEVASDYILLETLLRHYNLSREDVLKMWQERNDE